MKWLCVVLLTCTTAFAFETIKTADGRPVRWDQQVIPYRFDGYVPRQIKQSFRDQMRKWEAATSGRIVFVETRRRTYESLHIMYSRKGWIGDNTTLAYTFFGALVTPIKSACIIVNGHGYDWHRGEPFAQRQY
jgi:hypothetical protein